MQLKRKTLEILLSGESIIAPSLSTDKAVLQNLMSGPESGLHFLISSAQMSDFEDLKSILSKLDLLEFSSIYAIDNFAQNYTQVKASEFAYFSNTKEFDEKYHFKKIKKKDKAIWLCPSLAEVLGNKKSKQKLWKLILEPFQKELK